jgi:hypothetical protein
MSLTGIKFVDLPWSVAGVFPSVLQLRHMADTDRLA